MTHQNQNKSGLNILQEAISEGEDAVQLLLKHTLQRVLEEEMTAFLNAETYERTDNRKGYRNGYKPRTLKTRVGRIELMVPKDREGRFQTELSDRCQRNEKALILAIMEMYVQGVSTRKVKKITEELCGLDISRSQVSNLAKGLDEEIAVWRNRPLKKEHPYSHSFQFPLLICIRTSNHPQIGEKALVIWSSTTLMTASSTGCDTQQLFSRNAVRLLQ